MWSSIADLNLCNMESLVSIHDQSLSNWNWDMIRRSREIGWCYTLGRLNTSCPANPVSEISQILSLTSLLFETRINPVELIWTFRSGSISKISGQLSSDMLEASRIFCIDGHLKLSSSQRSHWRIPEFSALHLDGMSVQSFGLQENLEWHTWNLSLDSGHEPNFCEHCENFPYLSSNRRVLLKLLRT